MDSNLDQMAAKAGPQWGRWGAGMARALARLGVPLEHHVTSAPARPHGPVAARGGRR
jgi:hypothetical protein